MKLLFRYLEHLDSLRLRHAKRLMSWGRRKKRQMCHVYNTRRLTSVRCPMFNLSVLTALRVDR